MSMLDACPQLNDMVGPRMVPSRPWIASKINGWSKNLGIGGRDAAVIFLDSTYINFSFSFHPFKGLNMFFKTS